MRSGDAKSLLSLGFLTVVQHPDEGLYGGYLLLNYQGRPLEFHCTAPVKPNRAQQILYGATLEPFLYGEQIGQTLVTKAKRKPQTILTDLPSILAARDVLSLPVALVHRDDRGGAADSPSHRIDGPHTAARDAESGRLNSFSFRSDRLAVSRDQPRDEQRIAEALETLSEGFDLGEPFERIHEAIEEARRSAR